MTSFPDTTEPLAILKLKVFSEPGEKMGFPFLFANLNLVTRKSSVINFGSTLWSLRLSLTTSRSTLYRTLLLELTNFALIPGGPLSKLRSHSKHFSLKRGFGFDTRTERVI